jgi:hypothetical protein
VISGRKLKKLRDNFVHNKYQSKSDWSVRSTELLDNEAYQISLDTGCTQMKGAEQYFRNCICHLFCKQV